MFATCPDSTRAFVSRTSQPLALVMRRLQHQVRRTPPLVPLWPVLPELVKHRTRQLVECDPPHMKPTLQRLAHTKYLDLGRYKHDASSGTSGTCCRNPAALPTCAIVLALLARLVLSYPSCFCDLCCRSTTVLPHVLECRFKDSMSQNKEQFEGCWPDVIGVRLQHDVARRGAPSVSTTGWSRSRCKHADLVHKIVFHAPGNLCKKMRVQDIMIPVGTLVDWAAWDAERVFEFIDH